ncbi:hypothetical protein BY996DRAFT_6919501 [Phakopsora pachyrhizi]|nr:hypothetical protein BY996DRAFT_6919501 [Phakopsora pachyrhizi]
MTITSNNNNNQHQQQTADNNQSSSSQPNQPLNTFKQSSDHTNNQQHQHGSRLTRFLSKFTNTNLSYRRKSSLPNLNQHNQLSPFSSSTIPRNNDKHLENQSIRPSSSTSDLLPFSEESTNELEIDDGADPNASIRPSLVFTGTKNIILVFYVTPSSKAASNRSPTQPICTLSPVSQSVNSTSESLSIQSDPNQINNNLSSSSSSSLNNNSSNNNNNNNNNDYDTNSSIASTKPTTVISVDQANTMIGNNRIAQNSPRNRIIHRSNHLNSSNHLIQSNNNRQYHHQPRSSSSSLLVLQPATPNLSLSNSNLTSSPVFLSNSISKAPKHSLPHPSQNPHPAALADNASMLTLASSGFAPSLHTTQKLVFLSFFLFFLHFLDSIFVPPPPFLSFFFLFNLKHLKFCS